MLQSRRPDEWNSQSGTAKPLPTLVDCSWAQNYTVLTASLYTTPDDRSVGVQDGGRSLRGRWGSGWERRRAQDGRWKPSERPRTFTGPSVLHTVHVPFLLRSDSVHWRSLAVLLRGLYMDRGRADKGRQERWNNDRSTFEERYCPLWKFHETGWGRVGMCNFIFYYDITQFEVSALRLQTVQRTQRLEREDVTFNVTFNVRS